VRNISFAAVRKEFSDVCPDKEVHRLVTTFRDKGRFLCDTCSPSERRAEITIVPIWSSASTEAARIQYWS